MTNLILPHGIQHMLDHHECIRPYGELIDRVQDWYTRNEADLNPVAAIELRELLLGQK